jgi:hypothetical protein
VPDVRVRVGTVVLDAVFTEENPQTAAAVRRTLPLTSRAQRWGEEVYFEVPVSLPPEHGRRRMGVGDVAYWPAGRAIAIFFGPTPASDDDEPVAYDDVNAFARIVDDATLLAKTADGDAVRLDPI